MQTRKPLVESPNGSAELSNEEIARYSRHLIMPEVARGIENGVVVTILCDGADKYLSERFWED